MSSSTTPIDPKLCPLCGGNNHCANEEGTGVPCWCLTASIPKEAIEQVPEQMKGLACICQGCVKSLKEAHPHG